MQARMRVRVTFHAGETHYVALSVVGTDRLTESPYMRAKVAQENLIKKSGLAYSIVHSTQFFEFVRGIADSATVDNVVRLPYARIQPIAADDVASAVCRIAVGEPVNGTVEIAGPEQFGLDELAATGLRLRHDPREVVVDPDARYYGAHLQDLSLIPGEGAQIFGTRFQDWAGGAAA